MTNYFIRLTDSTGTEFYVGSSTDRFPYWTYQSDDIRYFNTEQDAVSYYNKNKSFLDNPYADVSVTS